MRKMQATALGCVIALLSAPASSQTMFEVLAGAKFCKTLTDDAQRLKCFDSLFAEKPSPTKPEGSEPEASWNVTESKSPIDDSAQVAALLQSVDSKAYLILRCREKSTDAFFKRDGAYLGSDSIKVLVRINDGKPVETRWTPAADGGAAFAPSAVQFIRALPDNGKLFVRANGYRTTADGEFQLGEVSSVRDKIARACNWPTPGTSTQAPVPKSKK